MKLNYKLLVALFILSAAFAMPGHAKERHAKSKSKALKPLPPGPEWVDTNHDGQLSNEEFQRAKQILDEKIKKVEAESPKKATSTKP